MICNDFYAEHSIQLAKLPKTQNSIINKVDTENIAIKQNFNTFKAIKNKYTTIKKEAENPKKKYNSETRYINNKTITTQTKLSSGIYQQVQVVKENAVTDNGARILLIVVGR